MSKALQLNRQPGLFDSGKLDKEDSLLISSLQSDKSSASTKYRSNISSTLKDFCLDSSFNAINTLLLSSINDFHTNCLFSTCSSAYALCSDDAMSNAEQPLYIDSLVDAFDDKLRGKLYHPKVSSTVILKVNKLTGMNRNLLIAPNQSTLLNSTIAIEKEGCNEMTKTIEADNSVEIDKGNDVRVMAIGKKADFASKVNQLKPPQAIAATSKQSPKGIKTIHFVKETQKVRVISPKAVSKQSTLKKTKASAPEASPKKLNACLSKSSLNSSSKASNSDSMNSTLIIKKKIHKAKSPISSPRHLFKDTIKRKNIAYCATIQSFALNDNQKILTKSPSFIDKSPIHRSNKKATTAPAYNESLLKPSSLKKDFNHSTDNIFNSASKKHKGSKPLIKFSNIKQPLATSTIQTSAFDTTNDIFQLVDTTAIVKCDQSHTSKPSPHIDDDIIEDFNEQQLRDEHRERITARFLYDDPSSNTPITERFSFNNYKGI